MYYPCGKVVESVAEDKASSFKFVMYYQFGDGMMGVKVNAPQLAR
jgi:hypothetical protein